MSEPQPPRRSLNVLSDRLDRLKGDVSQSEPTVPTNISVRTANSTQAPIADAALRELRTVYDPEIPVNIVELGLIYELSVDEKNAIHVRMTLTAPGCPVAGTLPGEIERKLAAVDGVSSAKVQLVWEPAWTKDRMSEVARLELGMF